MGTNEYHIYILAGGMGKRMNSSVPKVCVEFINKPMLVYLLQECLKTEAKKIFVVVGKYIKVIKDTLEKYNLLDKVIFVIQEPANGTGHAVMVGMENLIKLNGNSNLVVLYGDTPLTSATLIHKLGSSNCTTILAKKTNKNYGLGRIITYNSEFIDIIEEKDANEEQKKITLVNTGLYSFPIRLVTEHINKITNNNSQKEYYLTDLPKLIKNKESVKIEIISNKEEIEVTGVNTKEQLKELERQYKLIGNIN